MEFVEQRTHSGALILGVAKDGGTSTNVGILLFDLGCPSLGNDGGKNALKG